MIGFFDSGLGGLTVVRRVRELLPQHDLIFLADQKHVPYGDRDPDQLAGLMRHNLAWLESRGVDAIVMACNTSCAIADLRGYPQTVAPILDLIESAAIAVRDAGFSRIGVVATRATVESGAYGRKVRALLPDANVTEVAAPALVPLVEAGAFEDAGAAVTDVCARLPDSIDALILACTHYPVLDAYFAAALGGGIARIDPAVEQAGRAAALAAARGIAPGNGRTTCATTGALEAFRARVTVFLGDTAECEAVSS